MSTLKVGTVENIDGDDDVDVKALGTIKAWCNYTTTTATAINDSLGVSSITDDGSGSTTVNFSGTFSGVNYGYAHGAGDGSGGYSTWLYDTLTKTTAAIRLGNGNASFSDQDTDMGCISCFGDLA